MTEDEILNATHEQLRVWVAELMGWRWLYLPGPNACAALFPPGYQNPHWLPAGPGVFRCDDYGARLHGHDYPNDWGAAMEVVEKMDRVFEVTRYSQGHWSAYFGPVGDSVQASADTAPEAICKAALLATLEAH